MECLLSNLVFYANKPFTVSNTTTDTIAEVLVKLVRVIANMSVNDDVGHGLGLKPDLGIVLLTLILAVNNAKHNAVSCLICYCMLYRKSFIFRALRPTKFYWPRLVPYTIYHFIRFSSNNDTSPLNFTTN